jgi:hypothetical protein
VEGCRPVVPAPAPPRSAWLATSPPRLRGTHHLRRPYDASREESARRSRRVCTPRGVQRNTSGTAEYRGAGSRWSGLQGLLTRRSRDVRSAPAPYIPGAVVPRSVLPLRVPGIASSPPRDRPRETCLAQQRAHIT